MKHYPIIFYYKKFKNAGETCGKIFNVYGYDSLTEHVCQKWFGDFYWENVGLMMHHVLTSQQCPSEGGSQS